MNLLIANGLIQADEKIRRSKIAIILGNFVFEDQLVAKGIPSKFGNNSMVLVKVVSIVSKYQIRLKSFPHGLKEFLDSLPLVRKKTVTIMPDDDFVANSSSTEEQMRSGKRLAFAARIRTENRPVEIQIRIFLYQSQDRAPAADLDVVTMSAEAQDVTDPAIRVAKTQIMHAGGQRDFAVLCVNQTHCRRRSVNPREVPSILPTEHDQKPANSRVSGGP